MNYFSQNLKATFVVVLTTLNKEQVKAKGLSLADYILVLETFAHFIRLLATLVSTEY
jgi:hypothetical protein